MIGKDGLLNLTKSEDSQRCKIRNKMTILYIGCNRYALKFLALGLGLYFVTVLINHDISTNFFFVISDVEKGDEHPNLENVPSNLYESVCMPDFNEFFQQQGESFPLPDHNKNTTMNNNNNTGQQQQYMESK